MKKKNLLKQFSHCRPTLLCLLTAELNLTCFGFKILLFFAITEKQQFIQFFHNKHFDS